jgi:hypothetical protein
MVEEGETRRAKVALGLFQIFLKGFAGLAF